MTVEARLAMQMDMSALLGGGNPGGSAHPNAIPKIPWGPPAVARAQNAPSTTNAKSGGR